MIGHIPQNSDTTDVHNSFKVCGPTLHMSEQKTIQKLAGSETTGCPDSETPPIQKLADSENADSETGRFRNLPIQKLGFGN